MYSEQVSWAFCGVLTGLEFEAVVCRKERVTTHRLTLSFVTSVFWDLPAPGVKRCPELELQLRILLWSRSDSGSVIFWYSVPNKKHALSSSTFPAELWP